LIELLQLTGMKQIALRTLFAIAGLALIVAVIEIAVRLVVDDGMHPGLETWKYAREMKVASQDPKIGFEHGANREARLMGVTVRTNADGLRDRQITSERKPGVMRIAMLGDSRTLGWGVSFDAIFADRIERRYSTAGVKTEAINFGVGNWNTVQQVRSFLTKGREYQPDIVVLTYFLDDAAPAQPYSGSPGWLLRNCPACLVLGGLPDSTAYQSWGADERARYYLGLYDGGQADGWLAAKAAISRLAAYCEENDIELLIAHLPDLRDVQNYRFGLITELIRQTANENDAAFVDLLPVLQFQASDDLWVSPSDPHPNAFGHKLIANGLFSALQKLDASARRGLQQGAALAEPSE